MVFDFVLAVVEQAWNLSVAVAPIMFLAFFTLYFMFRGEDGSYLEVWISSQRDLLLQYSVELVAGFVLGGLAAVLLPGSGVVLGAMIMLAAGAYAYHVEPLPMPTDLDLRTLAAYPALVWATVPFLAVSAIVLDATLLKHVLALLFYTAIFWKL